MQPISFYGASDMGRIRTNNEDSYIVCNIWDDNNVLAVAIDGVGGYEGGEVAAEIARKSIKEYLENYPDGERLELLKQAVVTANNNIFAERENNPDLSSMSCVLTAILVQVDERRINMAHVGDTRLYEFANGMLSKLSHDHSLVGYREEIGELTEDEAMHHPQRNIISRDVGSQILPMSGNDYIETAEFPLLAKSTLMLCSDGLCDMVTSAQMTDILSHKRTAKTKVEALIEAANDAGGKDNVTVVVVDVNLEEGQENEPEKTIEVAKVPPKDSAAVPKPKTPNPKTPKVEKTSAVKKTAYIKEEKPSVSPSTNHDKTDNIKRTNKNSPQTPHWLLAVALAIVAGYFAGAFTWDFINPSEPEYVKVPVVDTVKQIDTLFLEVDPANPNVNIEGRTVAPAELMKIYNALKADSKSYKDTIQTLRQEVETLKKIQ